MSHLATLLQSFVVSFTLGDNCYGFSNAWQCIPFILKRFNIDPAFSAGPFLATIMDILGMLNLLLYSICCYFVVEISIFLDKWPLDLYLLQSIFLLKSFLSKN